MQEFATVSDSDFKRHLDSIGFWVSHLRKLRREKEKRVVEIICPDEPIEERSEVESTNLPEDNIFSTSIVNEEEEQFDFTTQPIFDDYQTEEEQIDFSALPIYDDYPDEEDVATLERIKVKTFDTLFDPPKFFPTFSEILDDVMFPTTQGEFMKIHMETPILIQRCDVLIVKIEASLGKIRGRTCHVTTPRTMNSVHTPLLQKNLS